ncbi:Bgt-20394 [Blumeria graminis f. sp. tritici]|uniref:Bgt-20394 n=2 Tax=Blumeria graminis f. sp. tritici TaxID=62690 RepID=A0A381LCC0_BLUGR|nr:Bgt-20394 [Blumeria graminis f. sp. tritici]
MGIREVWTSLQDGVEEERNLDGFQISNLGQEIHILKSIVRAKPSTVRVQLTL